MNALLPPKPRRPKKLEPGPKKIGREEKGNLVGKSSVVSKVVPVKITKKIM